jgi:hypothetical protein
MNLSPGRPAALVTLAVLAGCPCWGHAAAQEGGSGHHVPGAMASFVDAVAPAEAFLLRLNVVDHSGAAGRDRMLPIAGMTAWARRPRADCGTQVALEVDVQIRLKGDFVWLRVLYKFL